MIDASARTVTAFPSASPPRRQASIGKPRSRQIVAARTEYSIALPAADAYFQQHTRLTAPERRKAITYIAAHVEDEVEAAHFLVVVEALDRYLTASQGHFDSERASQVFRDCLRNLAPVMRELTALLQTELAGRGSKHLSATGGA